ncbi:restriction endonuclease subunit S [Anabaena azotica]|uniref:Restriction endonuclease subunit S n=1 Tax=Anabaena azotica FACHB-119 TaxID=947527 RepID=A0ABR8CY15_9NOST|nr:restriction endonuclease subunit S [Anabaena azotica]MBD2499824.1 restriction endonuclease subunit S [Anabaena azotica FACHB-119]
MSIQLIQTEPLILTITEDSANNIDTIDAGAAYTQYLHDQVGDFEQQPLGNFVEVVSKSINPRSSKYAREIFEYIDCAEIDEIYGYILRFKINSGGEIGSTKNRFQKHDILFAKVMPTLANKKIALVTEDVTNAVASTELIVLRKKPEVEINLYYLFRALRSDHFTRQAIANVTGATGLQRINPSRLLELKIIVPPQELQNQIGDAVEQEFTLRTLAAEQSKKADDLARLVLGSLTLRTDKKRHNK